MHRLSGLKFSNSPASSVDISALSSKHFLVSESAGEDNGLFAYKDADGKINKELLAQALEALNSGERLEGVDREALYEAWNQALKLAKRAGLTVAEDSPQRNPYELTLGLDPVPVGECVEMRITENVAFLPVDNDRFASPTRS